MCVPPSLKNSHLQMFFIIGVLKIFAVKQLCWILFLDVFQSATLLKKDSNTDVYLRILRNF